MSVILLYNMRADLGYHISFSDVHLRHCRFGSFEIFLPVDDFMGRQGPSAGRHDIRAQLLDYVIETFYSEIQAGHTDRKARNAAFFREVHYLKDLIGISQAC